MNIRELLKKRRTLSAPLSLLLILAASVGLTAAMLVLQINGFYEVLKCLQESRCFMFLLNLIPVLLPMLLLFFASGNLVVSVGTVSFIMIVLSVINRFKMIFRYDPLMPWDFALGGEFLGIAKSFSPQLIFGTLGGFLLIIIVAVVAFRYIKNEKMNVWLRLGGVVATAVLMAICNKTLLSSYKINRELYVIGNIYNQLNQYNSKGFLYQFIYAYNTGEITKPDGYDRKTVEGFSKSVAVTTYDQNARKPHVFLILGEAFSELPMSPVLSYDGLTDPLANYKAIKAEADSGTLIVPNVGGGTADTEFDMLTGMNTRQFRGVPYSNMLVTKNMNGLPHIMAGLGYDTVALHPGYPWFYNRQNVFPFLGFRAFTSLKSFDETDNKGQYISETATYDYIIDDFNRHVAQEPGVPLFNFIVTIQNHGPYPDKYGTDVETNFHSSVPFSHEDENALSNYILGVIDMDMELGRLAETMGHTDEPVVIAYFGDHLPLLSKDIYDALIPDKDETTIPGKMKLNRLPYLIWANDAAKAIVKENGALPAGGDMSSFYFGAALMEYLGYGDADSFFRFLNDLKNEYPVILEHEYFTADGVLHDKSSEPDERIGMYEQWSYYQLFDAKTPDN